MSRGLFYARLDRFEWNILGAGSDGPPFDGAVIREDYLAPWPEGDPREDEPNDKLAKAVEDRDIPWALDPHTAPLGHRFAVRDLGARARKSALAEALELPLSVERLRDPHAREKLVDIAAQVQLNATPFAAPYREVAKLDDPSLGINLALLRLSRERAGDRSVIAYLQMTGRRLRDGSMREAAKQVLDAGADVVFIRVRRFSPEQASATDFRAYIEVVAAIEQAGGRAVPDCVGRLGPPLVAAGADAFATNALRFRKVATALLSSGGGGGTPPLEYEVTGAFYGLAADQSFANVPDCPQAECPGKRGEGSNLGIRIHNLHEFRRLSRLAAKERFGFAEHLGASGSAVATSWAEVLRQFEARAA